MKGRVPVGSLALLGLFVLLFACDLRSAIGPTEEQQTEAAYDSQLAAPKSSTITVSSTLPSNDFVSNASIETAVDGERLSGGTPARLSVVDIGAGEPGFLVDESDGAAIPFYIPQGDIDAGSASISADNVALALLRLTPYAMYLPTDEESAFLDRCRQHPEFPTLTADIQSAIETAPQDFLDFETFPHIYTRVARIAAETFDSLSTSASRNSVAYRTFNPVARDVGNTNQVHLVDAASSGFGVENPTANYYGLEINGGDARLLEGKSGWISFADGWPPFARPVTTHVDVANGNYRLRLYKGFNFVVDGERSLDWLNPTTGSGKATWANSLVHIRLMLKLAGLIVTATGAGAPAGQALSIAASVLNRERISYLLTLDEKIRQQQWIQPLADALSADGVSAREVLQTAVTEFTRNEYWDELSLWLWESYQWPSTQTGLRVTKLLEHLGTALNQVLQGLNVLQLANEALPFYYDMVTSPWVPIDYVVSLDDGTVTQIESHQPPSADVSVSSHTPRVGEPVTYEAINISDDVDSAGQIEFRWDYDGDGSWDTGWASNTPMQHSYSTRGPVTVLLECRDRDGMVSEAQTTLTVGAPEEIKIILTWGANPSDLDSHLVTPSIEGSSYHVYYSDKGTLSAPPYAWLDIDDTTSYGPETMWIERFFPGTYVYSVYLYYGSGDLPHSSAVVNIVNEDGLIASYSVPTSGTGRWWNVFTIDGATRRITPINRISDTIYSPDAAANMVGARSLFEMPPKPAGR